MRFPNALKVIKKLRPLAADVPKTAEKKRLAVTWAFAAISSLGTTRQSSRTGAIALLTGSKVGDVAQDVQDRDNNQRQRCRTFDSPDRVLYLGHDVESVLVSLVRKGDVNECVGQIVPIRATSSEGIPEVGRRIYEPSTSSQNDKASDGNAGTSAPCHATRSNQIHSQDKRQDLDDSYTVGRKDCDSVV